MLKFIQKLTKAVQDWVGPNLDIFKSSRQVSVWLVATLLGVVVSIAAIIFRELIGLVQYVWLADRSENIVSAISHVPAYVVFLAPVIGGFMVGWAWKIYCQTSVLAALPM